MYQHACSVGLEGVVSKVRNSRYPSGRGNDWVKKTCQQRETLPIAGFALKTNKFDGIYLGRRKGTDLVYAGKVDHGFDKSSTAELQARLEPLIRKTQPRSRIAAAGSNPHCWRKSITARRRPRARCGIRSSRAFGRICNGRHTPSIYGWSGSTMAASMISRRSQPGSAMP
jgi:ATP-dependent DNA ligase